LEEAVGIYQKLHERNMQML